MKPWVFELTQPAAIGLLRPGRKHKRLLINKNSVSPGHTMGGVARRQLLQEPAEDTSALRRELQRKREELEQLRIQKHSREELNASLQIFEARPRHRLTKRAVRFTPEPKLSGTEHLDRVKLAEEAVLRRLGPMTYSKFQPKVHSFNPILGASRENLQQEKPVNHERTVSCGRSKMSQYAQLLI